MKRAIRTSPRFQEDMKGNLGERTARLGQIVADRLTAAQVPPKKAEAAAAQVAAVFGKIEEGDLDAKQLAFIAPEEVDAATALATRITKGQAVTEKEIAGLIRSTTKAVDIGLFGRMFAARGEMKMTAACEVAHAFTVDRSALETDYFVAKDDRKPAEEDVGAAFIGEQYFLSGLFYGYARIDMDQLVANLAGDRDLAERAATSFVRGTLTVSPSGKKATYGTNALASWAMIERSRYAPRSLAAAFLKPVRGEDHLGEAVTRAEALAEAMDKAYDQPWTRKVMEPAAGRGSISDLLSLVSAMPAV
jgi:CRISPR system Cascade subunit CasC